MKNKITKFNGLFFGSVLVLASIGIVQAEPSPGLMNSITTMRLEAQKTSRTTLGKANSERSVQCLAWSSTRNVTAGQSTIAVPEFAPLCGSREKEFKAAPLKQKESKRETN